MIVEYDAMQKPNSIKKPYTQVHIGTQPQDKYFYIILINDQSHREMKYNRNMKEDVLYGHVLVIIGVVMIAGIVIPVKTFNYSKWQH